MKLISRLIFAVPFALPHFVCSAAPLTAEQFAAVTAIEESCDRIGHEDKAHRALDPIVKATPQATLVHERASAQFKSAYDSYVKVFAKFSAGNLAKLCDSGVSTRPTGTSTAGTRPRVENRR